MFVDIFGSKDKNKKLLVFVVGLKLYSKGLCEGVDYVLRLMKVGGKRRVIVLLVLGFGEEGVEFELGF